MLHILEKEHGSRYLLDANGVDPFTQRPFSDMMKDAHSRKHDYYLARVQCKGTANDAKAPYYCYDARQLCKYVFEMVISTEGRQIRIKNFQDPINNEHINEISFFLLKYDSDTPLRAEYVRDHEKFLCNNSFRSRIFYQSGVAEELPVNFQFTPKEIPIINKRRFLSILIMVVILLVVATLLFVFTEKGSVKPYPLHHSINGKHRI
ncbi:hypothetical protein HK407_03g05270 [Ordospora pajunii]|uniref:uncharacterized protein n=1 Tax=Ordospora pajunii TaxID=3039483 RepID=UPI00295291DF|nr:uncharacterized protein HK407_03g05270 [Ordospora pajunii]KAH9411777.1 hypothetical protein HK407_03g05270 [Ordospora pajunii]